VRVKKEGKKDIPITAQKTASGGVYLGGEIGGAEANCQRLIWQKLAKKRSVCEVAIKSEKLDRETLRGRGEVGLGVSREKRGGSRWW